LEIVGTWTDITEHKLAERRQTLMMRELDHRVKNNLAAVLALAEQSLATSTSMEAFRASYTGRIRALVRTHEALASARWAGVGLEQIVLLSLAPYCGRTTDRVRINGVDVILPARASTPVGMVLHELATNAAKYGSLSVPAGAIEVSWRADGDRGLKLRWVERDGPLIEREPARGYGLSLIRGLIAHELRGSIDLRFEPAGLVGTITIPAAALRAEPSRLDDQHVPEEARAR
jgi:two-component sensor histidine kinase